MTPIAAMVKELLERGVPHDTILIAIETVELAASTRHPPDIPPDSRVETSAEKRRAWDREYRRKKRTLSTNSTRHPPDFHPNPPDIHPNPPDESLLLTSLTKNLSLDRERERKQNVHPTRGHRLPDDWMPTLQDRANAETMLGSRVTLELEKFRDHWKQQPGGRGVKLDWNAAWRNWARRAADYQPGGINGRRKTVQDAARELHEQTVAAVLAFDEPAPRSLRDGTGADAVRLLPPGRRE